MVRTSASQAGNTGSTPVRSTTLEKSMPRPARGGARRLNRTEFSVQKEIQVPLEAEKKNFNHKI